MTEKNLLITFDYELFLGSKSGQAKDCIIDPTEKIRTILNKYGIKGIFFIDTVYLYTLEKYASQYLNCETDLNLIKKQLEGLLNDGHYIYPHIHAHWLDAIYNVKEHEFDLSNISRYRFHNLTEDDKALVFKESFRILNSITSSVNPSYKIEGYRAGGWSIQPFSDFLPYFRQHGIRYDFSVMQGLYQFSNAQYFDFSDVPNKMIYTFNEAIEKEELNGEFTQIASSVLKVKPHIRQLDRLHRKLLFKLFHDHTLKRGIGQQSIAIDRIKPQSTSGISTNGGTHEPASIELLSWVKLPMYKKYITNNNQIHFVSHPKMLSNHNLSSLIKLLEWMNEHYKLQSDFKKIVNNS